MISLVEVATGCSFHFKQLLGSTLIERRQTYKIAKTGTIVNFKLGYVRTRVHVTIVLARAAF
jgi:uncharacterized protein YkvS